MIFQRANVKLNRVQLTHTFTHTYSRTHTLEKKAQATGKQMTIIIQTLSRIVILYRRRRRLFFNSFQSYSFIAYTLVPDRDETAI